jgi:hypothetical protein
MLVRGERWIVLNLARAGGPPTEEDLSMTDFAAMEATMKKWDEEISAMRRNAAYLARLIAKIKASGGLHK